MSPAMHTGLDEPAGDRVAAGVELGEGHAARARRRARAGRRSGPRPSRRRPRSPAPQWRTACAMCQSRSGRSGRRIAGAHERLGRARRVGEVVDGRARPDATRGVPGALGSRCDAAVTRPGPWFRRDRRRVERRAATRRRETISPAAPAPTVRCSRPRSRAASSSSRGSRSSRWRRRRSSSCWFRARPRLGSASRSSCVSLGLALVVLALLLSRRSARAVMQPLEVLDAALAAITAGDLTRPGARSTAPRPRSSSSASR